MGQPSVSLALGLVGALSPIRMLFYVVAEIVAAIAAAAVLDGLVPDSLAVTWCVDSASPSAAAVVCEYTDVLTHFSALGSGTTAAQGVFV